MRQITKYSLCHNGDESRLIYEKHLCKYFVDEVLLAAMFDTQEEAKKVAGYRMEDEPSIVLVPVKITMTVEV